MEKQFIENKRAYDLYVKKPLFLALLTVILPSLLMLLMNGVYIFTSQIILVRLVPDHGANTFQNLFGYTEKQINAYIAAVKSSTYTGTAQMFSVGEAVKASMSISSPLAAIISSSPFFIADGTSVLFTQTLGHSDKAKSRQIYKTGFWITLMFTLIETLLLCALAQPLLTTFAGNVNHVTSPNVSAMNELNKYYAHVHQVEIDFAFKYIMVLSAGIIMPMLIFFFSSLIRSEGKFRIVTIISVISNILNIGLSVLFIQMAKMGVVGGALSCLVCYFGNLVVLLFYLAHLIRKNDTWLTFKDLKWKKNDGIQKKLISPILLIGLSAFLLDTSYAIAGMFYIPILANMAEKYHTIDTDGGLYFQTISGAVMPIMNLVFTTIYGIVEGERIIISYNYSIGNWKRVKRTYVQTIVIAFTWSLFVMGIIAGALGQPVLRLFDIKPDMMTNAYRCLLIELTMIPIFSLQIGAMSIFMSIGDIIRSNISAIFQDIITYFPTLGLMVLLTTMTGNIWFLVATYAINAVIATSLMTWYTCWYLKNRFARAKLRIPYRNGYKKIYVPLAMPKMSLAQQALLNI